MPKLRRPRSASYAPRPKAPPLKDPWGPADSNINAADGTINGLMGWISCYEKAELKGVVKGLGIERPSDIEGHKALIEAYEMGKNV